MHGYSKPPTQLLVVIVEEVATPVPEEGQMYELTMVDHHCLVGQFGGGDDSYLILVASISSSASVKKID